MRTHGEGWRGSYMRTHREGGRMRTCVHMRRGVRTCVHMRREEGCVHVYTWGGGGVRTGMYMEEEGMRNAVIIPFPSAPAPPPHRCSQGTAGGNPGDCLPFYPPVPGAARAWPPPAAGARAVAPTPPSRRGNNGSQRREEPGNLLPHTHTLTHSLTHTCMLHRTAAKCTAGREGG